MDKKYCDRCEQEIRPRGDNPPLTLKSLGLYESPFQIMLGVKSKITLTSSATDVEIGSVNVANSLNAPRQLHLLPGRPINAYLVIKEVGVRMRVTAGTTATPATLNAALKWRDLGLNDLIVGVMNNLAVIAGTAEAGALFVAEPIIPAAVLGELPTNLGAWVLDGTFAIGTATSVDVNIYANFGVLYGVP